MSYKVRELAIDQMFFQGIFQTLLYIVYLSLDSNNFQWNILFEGSLTAIFYALSIQCLLMACEAAAQQVGMIEALAATFCVLAHTIVSSVWFD